MADGKTTSVELQVGTWAASLGLLIQKGLRFGSFIDIGSADGYFGLAFWRAGCRATYSMQRSRLSTS